MQNPFYDPNISYEDNYAEGPFGDFADGKIYRQKGKPQYDFLGQKVYLPFGIPAGPLINSNFCKAAFEKGFDICIYKTRRSIAFPTNAWPNVVFVDVDGDLTLQRAKKPLVGSITTDKDNTKYSITNSFGNPSPDPHLWQKDLKKALKFQRKGQLLIASVVGTIQKGFSEEDYYWDFAKAALMAKETGVKVIEINLSCPNVASEGVICYSVDAVESICKKVREEVGGDMKILIKIGYFSTSQQKLLEDIFKRVHSYIEGVSAINTIPATVVDEQGKQFLPGEGRLTAGICGASIKWAGLDMVKRLKEIRGKEGYDFAIIGVGGVMSPEDFFEYRKAGADLVQSCTGAMWNPYLALEVKKKLNNS